MQDRHFRPFVSRLQLRNRPHTNDLQLSIEVHLYHQSRLRSSCGLPHAFELKPKLLSFDHDDSGPLTRFSQNFASGPHPSLVDSKAVVGASTQCYPFWRWMAAFLASASWLPVCIHFALRSRWAKTVMPLQNSFHRPSLAAEATQYSTARQPLDQLFSLAYEELRRLASSVKRGDPSSTLTPTALVNEAWVKLSNSPGVEAESLLHFKRIAARAMRQLLIEAARRRNAHKRGGEGAIFVTFDDSIHGAATGEDELLVLEDALTELSKLEPRQAAIVESRFFGGLEISEIAKLLDISEATVLRDWRAAKAWLGQRLRGHNSART